MRLADRPWAVVVCCAIAVLTIAGLLGCGGGEGSSTTIEVERPEPGRGEGAKAVHRPDPAARVETPGARKSKPPQEAEQESRPAPAPAPNAPDGGNSAAREAGRQACAGMTPLEAARHFELPARHTGVDKKFAKFVADPPPSTASSSGYPRLVAAVYAATLPPKARAVGAAGCAEELALTSPEGGTRP